jgi:uncharacterized membrane protein
MRKVKFLLKILMALFYILAGARHFWNPAFYLRIMPPYLPAPEVLNYVSGAAEIVLGVLLLVPRWSRLAAWGLIALLIAVLPANLNMALHPDHFADVPRAFLYLRLPLQLVLILWAYWYTHPDELRQYRRF